MGLFGKSKFDKAFEPYQMGVMPGDQPMPERTGGMFGNNGFKGKDWLGLALASLGGVLSERNGGQSWAAPMAFQGIQQMRQAEQEQKARQQERSEKREDWQWQKQWELEHQPPDEPPSNVQTALWYQTATPEQRKAFDEANPFVVMTQNGPVPVPRGSIGNDDQTGKTFADPRISGGANVPSGNPLQPPQHSGAEVPTDPESVRAELIREYGPRRGEAFFVNWKMKHGVP